MSNARPKDLAARAQDYQHQTGRLTMTRRQRRQFDRMARLAELRHVGALTHGASGLPVRRPHPHARGGAR